MDKNSIKDFLFLYTDNPIKLHPNSEFHTGFVTIIPCYEKFELCFCKYCGLPLVKSHHRQKYHPWCRPLVDRENGRLRQQRFRQRWKWLKNESSKDNLGSGKYLKGVHPHPNPEVERIKIDSEMKYYGLR
jgi:hypothetical protein